jgi:hypothetical protein
VGGGERGGINKYRKTYSEEQLVNDAEAVTVGSRRLQNKS